MTFTTFGGYNTLRGDSVKKLYVLEISKVNAGSYDLAVSFDKNEAVAAFEDDFESLTEKSLYKYTLWVYRYDGKEESAEKVWREMCLEGMTDRDYIIDSETM